MNTQTCMLYIYIYHMAQGLRMAKIITSLSKRNEKKTKKQILMFISEAEEAVGKILFISFQLVPSAHIIFHCCYSLMVRNFIAHFTLLSIYPPYWIVYLQKVPTLNTKVYMKDKWLHSIRISECLFYSQDTKRNLHKNVNIIMKFFRDLSVKYLRNIRYLKKKSTLQFNFTSEVLKSYWKVNYLLRGKN